MELRDHIGDLNATLYSVGDAAGRSRVNQTGEVYINISQGSTYICLSPLC